MGLSPSHAPHSPRGTRSDSGGKILIGPFGPHSPRVMRRVSPFGLLSLWNFDAAGSAGAIPLGEYEAMDGEWRAASFHAMARGHRVIFPMGNGTWQTGNVFLRSGNAASRSAHAELTARNASFKKASCSRI